MTTESNRNARKDGLRLEDQFTYSVRSDTSSTRSVTAKALFVVPLCRLATAPHWSGRSLSRLKKSRAILNRRQNKTKTAVNQTGVYAFIQQERCPCCGARNVRGRVQREARTETERCSQPAQVSYPHCQIPGIRQLAVSLVLTKAFLSTYYTTSPTQQNTVIKITVRLRAVATLCH